MYKNVEKVFIGKNVSRTSNVVAFSYLAGGTALQNAVEGEILVLDKNKNVMAAGATIADSDTIYIAEVSGTTLEYANEAGTAIKRTGGTANVYKLLISDPIVGKYVTSYTGNGYTAKVEKVATFTMDAGTAGREAIVRIVYKDIKEHPGQFTHTYRITETGTAATNATAMAAIINKHAGARVVATVSTADLILTAKPIPSCTSSIADIDKFSMVDFEVFYTYVSIAADATNGQRIDYNKTITWTLNNYGSGTWELVRDAEKYVITNQFGPTNRTLFPVIQPTMRTVINTNYDCINIESMIDFLTPDNGYNKKTKVSTKIYIVDGASQTANVLAVLNPWMASTPGALANVTF